MAETDGPPARVRIMGQVLTALVARMPASWPLIRGPMRRFFDRAAPGWDEMLKRGPGVRLAALEAALDLVGEPPQRVLDLGTGTGSAAHAVAARWPGARVTGVDISGEMIARARRKPVPDRVEFRVADAAALPFDDGEFDLVTQNNVPVFFAEAARVLAPGGRVVVASSLGKATPFHTPRALLRRGFARDRVEEDSSGKAGAGLFWVGRRLP